VAVLDCGRPVTYRELNNRANVIARQLMTAGLRRGGHAAVRMEMGADCAIVLLAVLKAGASYSWNPGREVNDWPPGISIRVNTDRDGGDQRYLTIDVSRPLGQPLQASPNLPVLTRGTDAACMLHNDGGTLLVPHATIAALQDHGSQAAVWSGSAGAFDMWPALMAGATLTIGEEAAAVAAA
jgi:hypothetical protein